MRRIHVVGQTNVAVVGITRYSRHVSTTSLQWQRATFHSKILVKATAVS